jgi:hypothetical protein
MEVVEEELGKLQNTIGGFQNCQLGNSLVQVLSVLRTEEICRKNDEGKRMLQQIDDLAKAYWSLETDTERVIMRVQAYGENLEVVNIFN